MSYRYDPHKQQTSPALHRLSLKIMKIRFRYSVLILLLVCLCPLLAMAQGRSSRLKQVSETTNVVKAYADSLWLYRQRTDSLLQRQSQTTVLRRLNADYRGLFVPLTFFDGVADRLFTLDSVGSRDADEALSYVYIHRPDLVMQTRRQMDEAGGVINTDDIIPPPSIEPVDAVLHPTDDVILPKIDIDVRKPNFWKFSGDYTMQFYQNYVSSNWYQGGENSYSLLTTLTLQANYNNKQKLKWENKLEVRLGIQHLKEDTVRSVKTSEDLIRYTGKVGLQASKYWYYTLQVVANTQLMRGYPKNGDNVQSDFMSPFNLNVSVGMDYSMNWLKGRLTGSVHLAPLAYNYKYCAREALISKYSIDEGSHHKGDYGSQMTVDFTWNICKGISWKSHSYLYTTYKRVEMQFENTFSFKVNKYISATFFIYPRYDDSRPRDDHHGYFQFKEYLSLGFNYSF